MNALLYNLIIPVFLLLTTVGCRNKSTLHPHWSYSGETSPEHWAEIEPQSACDGNHQSPVNVIETQTVYIPSIKQQLELLYNPETHIHHVVNNGHSIQFDFEPGDSLRYKNRVYHLNQLHFHEPSEHTIDGIRYPIEIHLVHSDIQTNTYTVLSILGREGHDNDSFEFLEQFLQLGTGEKKIIDRSFDLTRLLPANRQERFIYQGSLTTPPCSENVNWVIFKQPIILSVDEVTQLKAVMPKNNYRNEQPLKGRTVQRSFK